MLQTCNLADFMPKDVYYISVGLKFLKVFDTV